VKAPDPWQVLGIASTDDVRAIRRAYAAQLKAIDVDHDVEGYSALRLARDEALRLAANPDGTDAGASGTPLSAESMPAEPGELRLRVNPFRTPVLASGLVPVDALLLRLDPIVGETTTWRWTDAVDGAGAGLDRVLAVPRGAMLTAPRFETSLKPTIIAFAHAETDERDSEHFGAIIAILFPDGSRRETMPSPDEEHQLIAHFDGIRHSRRIGEMNHYADVERWCADIIAHGAPASNCLMAPAAAFFHWRERAGELGETDTVAFINRRLKVFEFVEAIAKPEHRWNKAWTELTTYAHEHSKRGWGVKRQRVLELLAHVRAENPDVEQHFDGTRVALWENERDWSTVPWVQITFGVIMLLAILGRCAEQVSRPDLSAPGVVGTFDRTPNTAEQRPDIDNALRSIGYPTLSLAVAERENAELAQMLKSNWLVVAEEGRGMAEFPARLEVALRDRLAMAIRSAPYEDAAEYQRLRLNRAVIYRKQGVVRCDDYLQRRDIPQVAGMEQIDRSETELADRVLRKSTGPFERGARDIIIPGEIVAEVRDRTRLSDARVRSTMSGAGDATDRCAVAIALLQAALRMPRKEALPLLRGL